MHLSLPRRRAGWIICFFQKSRQEAVVPVSGSQEGLESHGRINFGPHSSSLSPAGSSGRFESVIKLATGPSQICISPSEPSRTDTVQGQGGRGADPARSTILAYQDLVPRADAPRDSPSLADSSEEGSTDSETGHLMAPASRSLETSCLVPRRDAEVLGHLPQEVVDTITSVRAPSTRHAYALKWNLFVEWCSSHRENLRRCPIRVVLSFLQQGLERRLSPSTLRVYVAAIAANHDPVEGKSVGKHD